MPGLAHITQVVWVASDRWPLLHCHVLGSPPCHLPLGGRNAHCQNLAHWQTHCISRCTLCPARVSSPQTSQFLLNPSTFQNFYPVRFYSFWEGQGPHLQEAFSLGLALSSPFWI